MDNVSNILEAFASFNNSLYPFSVVIPVVLAAVFLTALGLNLKTPSYRNSIFMKVVVSVCYFYAGIPLLFARQIIGPMAITGVVVLVLLGALFLASSLDKNALFVADERLAVRIAAGLFIAAGIFFPAFEYLIGLRWPAMSLFGMEFPTIISVLGLMLLTMKRMPRYLTVIFFVVALFDGIVSILMGFVYKKAFTAVGYLFILAVFVIFFFSTDHKTSVREHNGTYEKFGISGREREIIELIVTGLSNKEIAGKLFVSSRTIDNHIYNIFRKTGAKNRVELIRLVRPDTVGEIK